MAIIDQTQVAILYETITGTCQLRGKIVIVGPETVDVTAFLARHPGLAAVIQPSGHQSHPALAKADPGHMAYHDAACRKAIAAHTGTPELSEHADRGVQLDELGSVVSVHKGVVPGLDFPDRPTWRLISHQTAEVGDTVGGTNV